jgi:hypothetical protein
MEVGILSKERKKIELEIELMKKLMEEESAELEEEAHEKLLKQEEQDETERQWKKKDLGICFC